MEGLTEIEFEEIQDVERHNEVCHMQPQTQFFREQQKETREETDMTVEVQEETVEKLNLKQQIDLKTLIADEAKQYIHMEELKKITKISMAKQINKVNYFSDKSVIQKRCSIHLRIFLKSLNRLF